jgi:electron-transferring-flavoprotein dehydrogenase
MTRATSILPARYQPALPLERLIRDEEPGAEAVPLDALFVGAGPAGLAGAIELKKRMPSLEIGVLEKAASLGEHCLSGAIVNPGPFRTLFPELSLNDLPFRGAVLREEVRLLTERSHVTIPAPTEMINHGNYVASICEIVRWLGQKADELGISILSGFPAESLLMKGDRVIGVRTAAAGLDRNGEPGPSYLPPTDIRARVTILSEGTRGALTQAWLKRAGVSSRNPQIFALGVKELWQVPRRLRSVYHTLGWPLPRDAFGGSWIYPMGPDRVSFGLVVGLDYRSTDLDVHFLLQRIKEHPMMREILSGGELLEWGAKTIPEGGYSSIPERLHGDGVLVIGDSAGLVNVAALKGIHYAMHSGILAARAIAQALTGGEPLAERLGEYDRMLRKSFVLDDLYRTRNMRLAFKAGFFRGGFKAELMNLTRGRFPPRALRTPSDAEEPKSVPQGELHSESPPLSKTEAVFRSGNVTRDDLPSHLIVGRDIPPEVARMYTHLCPAGVYELQGERLVVNAPNCIDCKATDVLGPRWTPREGGSGPRYREM